jgi:molybdate transport system substrate-binding protein
VRARSVGAALAVVLSLVGAAGCGARSKPASAGGASARGTVTVSAAASLTETFTAIGTDFEAAHPGTSVKFSFGGSSTLAQQLAQGAPADVFAAASPATMKQVTDAGVGAGQPTVFTRNQLVIAVPPGNPHGVQGLADLARPGVKVALCAEQVPCGAAAKKALATAGVRLTPVTLEQDVKGALTKVRLGEVDAALVYRTDARASRGQVDGVEFAESASAVNDYPIVVLAKAPNPAGARAFVDFVLGDKGRAVLTRAGFQTP